MQVPKFSLNYRRYTFDKPISEQIKIINEWRLQLLTDIQYYKEVEIERLKEKKKRMQQRLAQLPELIAKLEKERDYWRDNYLWWIKEKNEHINRYQKLKNDYLAQTPLDKRDWVLKKLNGFESNLHHYVLFNERKDATDALIEHNARLKIIKQSFDPIKDENQIKADIRKRVEISEQLQNEMMAPRIEQALRRYLQK